MSIATLKPDSTGGKEVRLWTPLAEVESEALTQLRKVAQLPWVFSHVAVMPDVHAGKGCTVGSVIAMKDALAPAAVGVDIGCGMGAIKTDLKAFQLPDNLHDIRAQIERDIPVGFNAHDRSREWMVSERVRRDFQALFKEFGDLDPYVKDLEGKAGKQCGTLGGGNHFIELCVEQGLCGPCQGSGRAFYGFSETACQDCGGSGNANGVWMMLHSGSRNIGKMLAEVHIWKAKELAHNQNLPDPDMAVFLAGTPEMAAYRRDLYWAQRYAFINREMMFDLYKGALRRFFPNVEFGETILCHHNYVSEEIHYGEQVFVTRKGAISASAGQLGIIPGSMGAKSFIVEGLGNPESFGSASHGAGRRMSRGKAKRTFTIEDLKNQTAGVECRKDKDVIDEIPGAYKDIEAVMRNQADLVKIKHELKQVLCVKG